MARNRKQPSPLADPRPIPRYLLGIAHDGEGDHHPVWRVSLLDAEYDGEWHWNLQVATVMKILRFGAEMERLTWQEIRAQRFHSKGRDSPKHKPIPISSLVPDAQKRLEELSLDECGELFRFRLGNMERLWGILSEESPRVFYPLWWDPLHKICP